MATNYSTSMNFNGQAYGVPPKTPTQKAVKNAVVGAAAVGAASVGYQKFLTSKLSNKFILWISKRTAADLKNKKKGIWHKILTNIEKTLSNNKIDWSKAGKNALIGGAVIGGISLLMASHKQQKENMQMQVQPQPQPRVYYA